ncbi:MAG: PucR family transcriptional regulator [Streptosporangiaceae bacterium]
MALKPDDWAVDEQLAELGRVLLKRAGPLATAMAERITAEVSFYREQPTVSSAELRGSCRAHLEYVLGSLGAPVTRDISPAADNGRRRAGADVPLPTLMDAYRVGTRFIWECFVAEAESSGSPDSATLVRASSQVWMLQTDFIEAMSGGYRDAMTTRVLNREHERSALVAALLEGRITGTTTLWETAEILRLTRRGPYVVVAAEVPEVGRQAIADAENRLRAGDISSAWRLLPDLQVGIVVLRAPGQLGQLVALLAGRSAHRVGISPRYQALDQTGQALRFARIAMTAATPGRAAVTLFDTAPLAVTAASTPEVMRHVTGSVLGPLAALPEGERTVLLDTLEAWRDSGGSASQAAERLFVHPNTVRHRLRRISAATGRSLTAPRDVAELCLALEAARQQPPPS